jgi:oligopeptide/dipeptide ABC transporter ATP-binding protein
MKGRSMNGSNPRRAADTSPVDRNEVLRVRDLRVTFHQRHATVHAVRGVSLSLDRGRALAIVGESGSGKTVTARTIMGLYVGGSTTVEGSIMLDGSDVVTMSERQLREARRHAVSMIYQDPMRSLNPVMTIGDQIMESLELQSKRAHRADLRADALELLDRVQIPAPRERLKAYPHQLSGGMRQRIVIAMALASRPKLLIADEPTTALDVTVQAQILDLIDGLRQDLGMALILISHDLAVAAERTDHIAVMYAGQVVEVGTTSQLIDDMRMPYTRALMNSTPGRHVPRRSILPAIAGRPLVLTTEPTSCPFAPRCEHRASLPPSSQATCDGTEPSETIVAGRRVRCWFPLGRDESQAEGSRDVTIAEASRS